MTEYGIFNDESADHSADEAVEAGMYNYEQAEKRLAEMRAENGDDDDNCYIHEVEEPEEDDDDDAEEEGSDEDEEDDE